jgi:RNAse (barnase) inhibitor barstar
MEMMPMDRAVVLDGRSLTNQKDMYLFFQRAFGPDFNANNLDGLYDALGEISEDVMFVLTRQNVTRICEDRYAYNVLLVIGRAAENNSHIKLQFAR